MQENENGITNDIKSQCDHIWLLLKGLADKFSFQSS